MAKPKMIPVQAYVDQRIWRKFRRRYGKHGAVTALIRSAFEAAIEEDELDEFYGAQAAKANLPPLPPATNKNEL